MLGIALARLPDGPDTTRPILDRLQHELFIAQTELAMPPGAQPPAARIEARHLLRMEADLDALTARIPPLKSFVLSRGGPGVAEIHFARTVARRAEREVRTLHRESPVRPELLQWCNRLSGLLFALALTENLRAGHPETAPDYAI